MTFVDTSAIYALIDRTDSCHSAAAAIWSDLAGRRERLVTSNYVALECFALTQSRLGVSAVRRLTDDLMNVIEIAWVQREEHAAAVDAVLAADRRSFSLVDAASFQMMRRLGIRRAFAFDDDFVRQGFEVLSG